MKAPVEFYAVHYKSKKDGSIKKYCAPVINHCRGCARPLSEPHADGCEKPAAAWFDAPKGQLGDSWLECAELVVAEDEAKAWASHKTRCKLTEV